MPKSKNDILADLKEKVRLVEKSGQFETVHHENLANYLRSLRVAKQEVKKSIPTIKREIEKEEDNGK